MATLLETDAVLKRGLSALALADPVMARLAANGVTPQLRRRPPGFEGLAWIAVERTIDRTFQATDLLCRRSDIVLDPGTGTTAELDLQEPIIGQGPAGNAVRTWTGIASFTAAIIELGGETIEEQERQGVRITHSVLVAAADIPSVPIEAGHRLARKDGTAAYVVKKWASRNDGSDFWTIQVEQVL